MDMINEDVVDAVGAAVAVDFSSHRRRCVTRCLVKGLSLALLLCLVPRTSARPQAPTTPAIFNTEEWVSVEN
jgi:hypothetical protein